MAVLAIMGLTADTAEARPHCGADASCCPGERPGDADHEADPSPTAVAPTGDTCCPPGDDDCCPDDCQDCLLTCCRAMSSLETPPLLADEADPDLPTALPIRHSRLSSIDRDAIEHPPRA
jgi:hypothetical protein